MYGEVDLCHNIPLRWLYKLQDYSTTNHPFYLTKLSKHSLFNPSHWSVCTPWRCLITFGPTIRFTPHLLRNSSVHHEFNLHTCFCCHTNIHYRISWRKASREQHAPLNSEKRFFDMLWPPTHTHAHSQAY